MGKFRSERAFALGPVRSVQPKTTIAAKVTSSSLRNLIRLKRGSNGGAAAGSAEEPAVLTFVQPAVALPATAAPVPTLRLLAGALAAGAVVLFPSFGYLFYVFKRPGPAR